VPGHVPPPPVAIGTYGGAPGTGAPSVTPCAVAVRASLRSPGFSLAREDRSDARYMGEPWSSAPATSAPLLSATGIVARSSGATGAGLA
jgi:hypothetical protein